MVIVITPPIRGMRTSVWANSSTYGYSTTITAAFGALNALLAPESFVAVFVPGAALAFTSTKLAALRAEERP
jgi:hypothetical protein